MILQKDFIIETYLKKGWLELYKITRSCKGDFPTYRLATETTNTMAHKSGGGGKCFL